MTRLLTILTSLLLLLAVLCSLTPISAQWQSTQIHTGSVSFQSVTNALGLTGNTSLFLNGAGALASPGGGGGDTTWTNSAGVITTTPTNANVLSFTSQSPDNATNVAVVVDTANDWTLTQNGPFLFQGRHHGTNKVQIYASGAVGIGRPEDVAHSDPENNQIIITKDATKGDPKLGVYCTFKNSDNTSQDFFLDFTEDFGAQMQLDSNNSATSFYWEAGAGYADETITIDGTPVTKLWPDANDGPTAIAYTFDTFHSLTNSAAKLASFKNDSVEKFVVQKDGATTVAQSASEPDAPAAGFFTLFAVDSGGKMVLKVKFPTGAAQIVATEP